MARAGASDQRVGRRARRARAGAATRCRRARPSPRLAGHPARRPVAPGRNGVSDALRRLLRAGARAGVCPRTRWDFVEWNRPFEALFPAVAELPAENCNLVWAMFASADARVLVGDWEREARRVLSQFRAETVPLRDDAAVVGLVERLRGDERRVRAMVAAPRCRRVRDAPPPLSPSASGTPRVRDPAAGSGR